jgi:inner membrane protein
VPSVLSHPAVPLAIAAGAGSRAVPGRLALIACAASVLPDIDALGYWAGIPYDAPLGHRGLTHSLFFALLVAVLCAAFAARLALPAAAVFGVVFLSAVSHGVLDAMTTGGMGVAFFSPFSNARYFLPWRVIRVSPIGISGFFSERGVAVLRSELAWVWAPCASIAALGLLIRRVTTRSTAG